MIDSCYIPYYGSRYMAKRMHDDLGLAVPANLRAAQINFRLSGVDARKLDTLAKRLRADPQNLLKKN